MFDNSEAADVKNEAYMEVFNKFGMNAINISEREMYVGYSKILEYQKKAKFDFISANIVYEKSEKPAFKTHTIIEKKIPGIGRFKIGVIGVTRYVAAMWETGKEERLKTTDFVKVTKEIVEKLKGKVDLIIVLAHFDRQDAKHLVEKVPGINIILASFGTDRTIEPYKINDTDIFYNGYQGRWIGELRINLSKKKIASIKSDYIYLDKQYPNDEEMMNYVEVTNQKVSDAIAKAHQEHQRKIMEETEKRKKAEEEKQKAIENQPSEKPSEEKPPR